MACSLPGQHVGQVLVVGLARPVGVDAVLELVLQQGLPDAGHVAVAEDAEAACEQLLSFTVTFAPLIDQKAHGGLGHGEPNGAGASVIASLEGSRGSMGWAGQVSRTQPWAGSSQMSQAAPGPGRP